MIKRSLSLKATLRLLSFPKHCTTMDEFHFLCMFCVFGKIKKDLYTEGKVSSGNILVEMNPLGLIVQLPSPFLYISKGYPRTIILT